MLRFASVQLCIFASTTKLNYSGESFIACQCWGLHQLRRQMLFWLSSISINQHESDSLSLFFIRRRCCKTRFCSTFICSPFPHFVCLARACARITRSFVFFFCHICHRAAQPRWAISSIMSHFFQKTRDFFREMWDIFEKISDFFGGKWDFFEGMHWFFGEEVDFGKRNGLGDSGVTIMW